MIGQTQVVLGKSAGRLRDFLVQINIGRHEKVGPSIPVEVADHRRAVPFGRRYSGCLGPFPEGAIPIIPEQGVGALGGYVKIPPAIAVEIRGYAAIASYRQIGLAGFAHVSKRTPQVAVECVARQPALELPVAHFCFGVAVDQIQIQPAVVVIVDPA